MAKDQHPTERVGRNPKIHHTAEAAEKPAELKHEKTHVQKPKKPTNDSILNKVKAAPKQAWKKFNSLSRNIKLATILAAVLLVVGVFAVILSTGNGSDDNFANEDHVEIDDSSPKATMTLTLQQGTLQTKDEDGNWVDVSGDFQPEEGDALRTIGATSRAALTIEDGTTIRIDANSEIELTSLNSERIVIRHIEGYAYSRVLLSEERTYTYIVESNNAQYEAQGTAFKTIASGDEQAVEVYQGSVLETSFNEEPKEGEKLTVKNRAEPSKDGQIEKLDIEEVKQDQFILWNKDLDEQDENFKNSLGFLKDFEAPEINITSHEEGQTVLLDSNANEGTIEFTGNTEKGATLTVQSKSQGGSSPINVGLGANGEFTTPVLNAPLGSSVFEFVSKDRTGNTTTKNIRINFQRKSAPVGGTGNVILMVEDYNILDDRVETSWAITGSLEAKDGYQIVYSKSKNPTYPSDKSSKVNSTSKSFDGADFESGKTYYFRVCVYDKDDDKCANYSNQDEVTIP